MERSRRCCVFNVRCTRAHTNIARSSSSLQVDRLKGNTDEPHLSSLACAPRRPLVCVCRCSPHQPVRARATWLVWRPITANRTPSPPPPPRTSGPVERRRSDHSEDANGVRLICFWAVVCAGLRSVRCRALCHLSCALTDLDACAGSGEEVVTDCQQTLIRRNCLDRRKERRSRGTHPLTVPPSAAPRAPMICTTPVSDKESHELISNLGQRSG